MEELELKLTRSPWFAAFTAIVGGLAGLLGSVFTTEVKSAFPFSKPGSAFVWEAGEFWIALFVFGLCFGLNIRAQSKAQDAALNKLTANTEKLETLIRTLPPEGFLSEFEDYYEIAFSQAHLAIANGEKEAEIRDAILACLAALAYLAFAFDGSNQLKRYAVNIMLFKKIPVDAPGLADLLKRLQFVEKDSDLAKLQGVLELQTEFSIVLNAGQNGKMTELDNASTAIALPISPFENRVDGARSTVLPGAPQAFCDPESTVIWPDASKLGDWCRRESGLRSSVADQIDAYFSSENGKKIKSFTSLTLRKPDGKSNALGEPLGIVNIHSDHESILGEAGATLFVPLTLPFRILLADLIGKLPQKVV